MSCVRHQGGGDGGVRSSRSPVRFGISGKGRFKYEQSVSGLPSTALLFSFVLQRR